MKLLIQRVREAAVAVDGETIGQIGHGLLVFVGVADTDTKQIADKLVDKMTKLRIFDDAQGKTNLAAADVQGEFLIVSQFTLYADCRKGNRPSFSNAGKPEESKRLYECFIARAKQDITHVDSGEFGADMQVTLTNDGPFTIWLDTDELKKSRKD